MATLNASSNENENNEHLAGISTENEDRLTSRNHWCLEYPTSMMASTHGFELALNGTRSRQGWWTLDPQQSCKGRGSRRKATNNDAIIMRNCPIPNLECTTSYVIYEGTCQHCQEENSYIGSTMQQLHHRVQQHIRAAAEHDFSSAFGEHYYRRHRSLKPDILFKIISRTGRDELRLRIQEAYEIQRRSPKLNRRTEELGTGFIA